MTMVTLIQFKYGKGLPLGAAYLAYGLAKEGVSFEVKLFDRDRFLRAGGDIDSLCSFLMNSKEIIAVGCYSDMLPYVLAVLKKIKQRFPKKTVILGGVGPTMVAEEIIESCEFVDFILRGNGISTLPRLVKKIKAGEKQFSDISGLSARNIKTRLGDDSGVSGLNIPKIPAYYSIKDIRSYETFYIKTSAGCPFQCTFCYALPAAGKKVINRNIHEVIEEIKLVKKIAGGRKISLSIIDEAFVVDKKRVIDFCSLLMKNKLEIQWFCYGRVNCMDEEMLGDMRLAGCVQIYYGVESGSDRVLKEIKKGFTIEEAIRIILLSKKIIPSVTASFIYRFPFETVEDFKYTMSALKYLRLKNILIQLHPLVPVKNSQIYLKYADRLKFSLNEYCDYIDGHTPAIIKRRVSFLPSECLQLIKKHAKVFYDYGYYESEDLHKINRLIGKI